MQMKFGLWDIRRAVLSGETDRVYKYLIRIWEQTTGRARTANAQNPKVTQWVSVTDLHRYNLKQQGCLGCE